MSQAGPTAPLEPDVPLEPDEPLEPELPDVPLEPDEPLVPELPEVPLEPEVPLVPDEPLVPERGGSLAPASGDGSLVAFVDSVVALPRSSAGDVAHAEMRATSDKVPTAMRLEQRMAGTVAAELCTDLPLSATRR